MDTLGSRVLLLRRDLNLTQDDVARRIGISRAHLSRIETGQAPHIMTDVLFGLARVLQTNAAYLLGESDDAVDGDEEENHMIAEITGGGYETTPDDKRLIDSLLDALREMSREDRLFLLMMAEKLRRKIGANGVRLIE